MQLARDVEFWRGLVQQTGKILGGRVYVQDDGGIVDEPLALRVPEVAAELTQRLAAAEAERDQAQVDLMNVRYLKDSLQEQLHEAEAKAWRPTREQIIAAIEAHVSVTVSNYGLSTELEYVDDAADAILALAPTPAPSTDQEKV